MALERGGERNAMPLLGPKEKSELETMIHDRLVAHWNAHGSNGLLAPGNVNSRLVTARTILVRAQARISSNAGPPATTSAPWRVRCASGWPGRQLGEDRVFSTGGSSLSWVGRCGR